MSKANTTASWIGKAAYEIIRATGRTGKEANRIARRMTEDLLDYGGDLAVVDPRDYALGRSSRPTGASAVLRMLNSPSQIERQNLQSAFVN